MMGFGIIFVLLIIALVLYVLGWRPRWLSFQAHQGQNKSPMDILKERYARGEITREQYDEIRKDLNQ
jgi:putative membrane protein